MKPNSPKPLSRILAVDAQIGAWHERMERESRVTAAVRRLLPRALADRVRVADAGTATLVLSVPAGAVAAVVRQRSPDLLAGLRREGWNFTEFRVAVQVGTGVPVMEKIVSKQPHKIDGTPLRALARELPAGPLRDAVERLARRG
ncbi:MAG: DciA family protein [Burkholderiales bacterium]